MATVDEQSALMYRGDPQLRQFTLFEMRTTPKGLLLSPNFVGIVKISLVSSRFERNALLSTTSIFLTCCLTCEAVKEFLSGFAPLSQKLDKLSH